MLWVNLKWCRSSQKKLTAMNVGVRRLLTNSFMSSYPSGLIEQKPFPLHPSGIFRGLCSAKTELFMKNDFKVSLILTRFKCLHNNSHLRKTVYFHSILRTSSMILIITKKNWYRLMRSIFDKGFSIRKLTLIRCGIASGH